MKKPKINQVLKDTKGYYVYCGEGLKFNFPSQREAKAFLSQLNRFLTTHLVLLNQRYVNLFSIYRSYFFIIHESQAYTFSPKKSFDIIDNCFDLAVNRSNSENGAVFTLQHIRVIYNSLQTITGQLLEIAYSRSDTPKIHELNAFKYDIRLIEKAFEDFKFEHDTTFINQSSLKAI
jgi:hypothetical protein